MEEKKFIVRIVFTSEPNGMGNGTIKYLQYRDKDHFKTSSIINAMLFKHEVNARRAATATEKYFANRGDNVSVCVEPYYGI